MTHPLSCLRTTLAALLCTAALGAAQAAVSVDAGDATAQAGQLASPTLTFDFDSPYALLSFGMQFSFDPAQLSFDAAASTVTLDGTTWSLAEVLSQVPAGELAVNTGIDGNTGLAFSDFSFIPSVSVPVSQQLVFAPAFRIAPTATTGQVLTVSFSGDLADDISGEETVFANAALVTVSAIPEPAHWMLLCGGLAVLGAAVRRRA